MSSKPQIFIERKAWDQIMAAVLYQDLEVQFFGRGTYAENDDRGHYILHEIIIPPQEVSGAFTDTGDKEQNIANLNFVLQEALRLGCPIEGWGFWGHSHVKMGTGPSGTDTTTMLDLCRMWGRSIGAVFNQRQEVTAFGAGPHPLFTGYLQEVSGLDVVIEGLTKPEVPEVSEWMKNVTQKVWNQIKQIATPTRYTTDVESVINSDTDPLDKGGTIFLSLADWNSITDTNDWDENHDAIYDKYSVVGWANLTPFERRMILPDLEGENVPTEAPTPYGYEGWE